MGIAEKACTAVHVKHGRAITIHIAAVVGIAGDHDRYLSTYMRPFPGCYFTGDGAIRDKDGYLWITGRVDGEQHCVWDGGYSEHEPHSVLLCLWAAPSLNTHPLAHTLTHTLDVLNVSGHRLGSAEIESALVAHPKVSEAAVIGFPHETKGEGICCYVTLKSGVEESLEVAAELRHQVRKVIGPFAAPDYVVLTAALPKTRSGKIMRRVLRKIIAQQTDQLGDITTLADPSVVVELIDKVNAVLVAHGVKLVPSAIGGAPAS